MCDFTVDKYALLLDGSEANFADCYRRLQMSLWKHPQSKYWYCTLTVNEKRVNRSTKTTNKKKAREVEKKLQDELVDREILGNKERLSLEHALKRFRDIKNDTPNHINIRTHVKWILDQKISKNKMIDDVDATFVNRLVAKKREQGAAVWSIKHVVSTLRGAWTNAEQTGYQVKPVKWPSIKPPKGKLVYMTPKQEKKFLKLLGGIYYDLAVLLLDTGVRLGEGLTLTWDSIDFEHNVIHVWRSKTDTDSMISMTNRLRAVLQKRNRFTNYVFEGRKIEGKDPQPLSNVVPIRKAIKKINPEMTIHTCRHTFATRLVMNGVTLYEVSKLLGHTDLKTSQRYSHLEHIESSMKAADVLNQLTA